MTGVEAYNNKYTKLANTRISKRTDLPVLKDYYNYLLTVVSISSAYMYLSYTVNFLDYVGKKDPKDMTLGDYTSYIVSIVSHVPSNQTAIRMALKHFSHFSYISKYNDDYMNDIPLKKVGNERKETKEKREKGYLTEEEIRTYLNCIKNTDQNYIWSQRDYTIVLVFLTTGIRCSALDKLDLNDIDLDNCTITVTEKRDSVRKINISKEVMDEIKTWLKYRDRLGADDNAVFLSNRRQRMTTETIRYMVTKKYGGCIKGKKVSPHKFRATYGTITYMMTNDIYFTQQAMGHSSPGTTELYIRGQRNNVSEKAASIINDYLWDVL